jgi:hypothetical protein
VWPTAYPESPDPRPTAYQLPTDLAAVIKSALLRENLVIAAKLGTAIEYHSYNVLVILSRLLLKILLIKK